MSKIKRFGDYINESVAQYDFGFTTELDSRNVSYYNEPKNFEYEYTNSGSLTINWEMDFDNRKTGINSMAPIINTIKGNYVLITPTDDEEKETEVEFSYEKNKDEWNVKCEVNKFSFGDSIAPIDIEIDFKTKDITVYF